MSSFDEVRRQIAAELRADALAGRGRLPRANNGQVSPAFLETLRELPVELTPRGAGGFVPLGAVLAEQLAGVQVARSNSVSSRLKELDGPAEQLARLEQLERELRELLERAAPKVWDQIRAPLYRLLRRARLELRRAPRSHATAAELVDVPDIAPGSDRPVQPRVALFTEQQQLRPPDG